MTTRLIEVPAYGDIPLGPQLEAAYDLAHTVGGHIRVTYVDVDLTYEAALLAPSAMVTEAWMDQLQQAQRDRKERRRRDFDAWCTRHGLGHDAVEHRLASTFAVWEERGGPIEDVVFQRGRLSDLIVVSRPTGETPAAARCMNAALFESGRPTMVVAGNPRTRLLEHVVVAWNGSLEATRAISQCTDILHEAACVSIFSSACRRTGDEAGMELQEMLRWRGIQSRLLTVPAGQPSTGAALVAAIVEVDASMLIMGAYTHSRLQQALLGGVTQHVLKHCPVPAIMAH